MLQKVINVLKKEIINPTPFLLLGVFGVSFLIYWFVSLLPNQVAGLRAAYILFALIIVLVVDRWTVRKFKLSAIILAELIIVSLTWLLISWSLKATTLIVKPQHDYFAVIFIEGGSGINRFRYTNLFQKEKTISVESCIVLDKSLQYLDKLEIKPHVWKDYSMNSEDIYVNGSIRTVQIYWIGKKGAERDKGLPCIEAP